MVHASPLSRHRLAEGVAPHRSPVEPLTAIGPNKIGPSDFYSFEQGFRSLFVLYGNTMESYISQNNILEIKETCSTAVLNLKI
jgi:hypothetical protein